MDQKTVQKVAKLAKLHLTDQEATEMADKLSGILKWVEQLSAINTDNVEEMASIGGNLRYRKDEVTDGDCREAVLANAPATEFDCFVVPKVIE